MALHTCPVCGGRHEVHPVLDRLAYGQQLTCSPRCKTVFPGLVRARVLAEIAKGVQDGDSRKARGKTC
ncbi:MAG TPA: hypothetical protein GXX56_02405 [Rhodocyclaceae bacterium]|jgi:hypothetical protein|nr:hypothetical protein [Rhodocyclaceae bacterium]